MRSAARFMAIAAVVLALVSGLYAADEENAKREVSAVTARALDVGPTFADASFSRAAITLYEPASSGISAFAAYPPPELRAFGGPDNYTPKIEWFLGYSFWRATPWNLHNRIIYLNGGSTSIAYNFNRYLGLAADFGGYANNRITLTNPSGNQTFHANGTVYTYMAGPRLSYRKYEMITPFVQALFGGAYATAVTIAPCPGDTGCTPLGKESVFAAMGGVGLDIKINRHVALRLVEADYLLTHFRDPLSIGGHAGWQNNVRVSTGIVFRFGGSLAAPPPAAENRPPSAACSLNRNSVIAGSNDAVAISTTASDPDGDPLTYSWMASGGRVDGTGAQVRWLPTGAQPGSYRVTVTVTDGRGGEAQCSVSPMVTARPNRPPTVTLTSDRDTVFVGEVAHLTARGMDPDNDPLTYSWRTSCGQLTAANTMGTLGTTGVAPGACTVTVRVEDGRGGAADASKAINIQAPPAPPQASKLSGCEFKPATSPRVDNVCKRILDDVGLRLQNEPRANVVVIGFAAPGARAAKLAGDRAENTAKYLAEKGVDRSRITTRTGSGQAGAGEENSRVDVIWVPEGATY